MAVGRRLDLDPHLFPQLAKQFHRAFSLLATEAVSRTGGVAAREVLAVVSLGDHGDLYVRFDMDATEGTAFGTDRDLVASASLYLQGVLSNGHCGLLVRAAPDDFRLFELDQPRVPKRRHKCGARSVN